MIFNVIGVMPKRIASIAIKYYGAKAQKIKADETERMKYKVGDRVKIKDKMPYRRLIPSEKLNFEGKIMTIERIGSNPFFDKYYQMKEDNGVCVWTNDLIDGIADEHKIVITTDGKTTTAKLYDGKKFIKEAKAKCSPEDKFDFETGATLAFSRLMDGRMNDVIDRLNDKVKELKQNRYFSGKAVFLDDDTTVIKKGKIYKFKDGQCKCDYGWKIPLTKLTEKEVEAHGFLPIKE